MILTHIAACSKNRVIGTQGDLPWNIPEDMKFFRETTKGHVMIMGRKTFDSFKGKALPNRFHIVITRNSKEQNFPSTEKSPVVFVSSVDEAVALAKTLTAQWGEEVFVIGGGEIYKQTLSIVDKIYLTLIEKEFAGDTYYPEIDEKLFTLKDCKKIESSVPFSFLTYFRK